MPPHPEPESRYTPQRYDSLFSAWYKMNTVEAYDHYLHDFIDIEPDTLPDHLLSARQIPDSVYRSRLRMIASVIELPYNDVVRRYIEAYTAMRNGITSDHIQQAFWRIREQYGKKGPNPR